MDETSFTAVVNAEKLDLSGKLVENKESGALFDAYQHKRNIYVAHDPRPEIYGEYPKFKDGTFKTSLLGDLLDMDTKMGYTKQVLNIEYSVTGNKGPVIFFLHGVPMNRRMKFAIMRRMNRFYRCV